jgi:ATP-dependent Lhr-like helicase
VTAKRFAEYFLLDPRMVFQVFLSLETQGLLLRGTFERITASDELDTEWCERRILQRIQKLTIATRRRQVEPVSPAKFMQWLLGWQHLAPQTQVSGEDGLLQAISRLE